MSKLLDRISSLEFKPKISQFCFVSSNLNCSCSMIYSNAYFNSIKMSCQVKIYLLRTSTSTQLTHKFFIDDVVNIKLQMHMSKIQHILSGFGLTKIKSTLSFDSLCNKKNIKTTPWFCELYFDSIKKVLNPFL